ncbi:unnamed protein product [Penicillium glandicola]
MKLSSFFLGALACAVSGAYAATLSPNAPYCVQGACEQDPVDCSDLGMDFASTPIYDDDDQLVSPSPVCFLNKTDRSNVLGVLPMLQGSLEPHLGAPCPISGSS